MASTTASKMRLVPKAQKADRCRMLACTFWMTTGESAASIGLCRGRRRGPPSSSPVGSVVALGAGTAELSPVRGSVTVAAWVGASSADSMSQRLRMSIDSLVFGRGALIRRTRVCQKSSCSVVWRRFSTVSRSVSSCLVTYSR